MKKLFLLIFIFTAVLYAEVAIVPIDKATEIADRNAASLWGDVDPGEPIIYYSIDENVVAYRFNYAINTQFLDKQTLINECDQGKLNGNREAQWGDGNYGNILMSARTDMPVNLEYGLGISSEYAYGTYMQEQAEEHLGNNYSLKRIYYINGVNVWYHYTNGSKDIYIKPHSPAKVGNEQEFRSAADEFEFFCETGNFETQWDDYLYRQRTISRTVSEIPYHDECCPFYDWSYGCTPTAAAMLLAYWDHRSMYSTSNYSKFVDYHFERTDPLSGGSCSIDSHCPNVMPELATAMNTDLLTGGTYRSDIAPGYNIVATNNGYSFSCSYNSGQTTDWYFNKVVSEINADRPLHISISGHSITGVGYNDVDETVSTHYTHQPWLVNITKSQLQATYPIIPGGAFGLGVEIEKPDGDQNYYGTGSGETLYAGDVYEITWDYDASAGSYVKLYYNTTHGTGSWTSITSNTPNDGVYDWVIPSGINSTACRIMMYVYSSGSVFWGADGSYGDFQIYSGGSLQTLYSDSKVNTTTDPDYYQFNNPYATWCAVGVRNNTVGENWSMRMYSDNTFTTELVSSTYTYPVDFVVLDRHHYSGINRGIKAYRFSGSNTASVEFEGDQETLIVGTNTTYVWTAGDVVEMFDVYLTPGIYSFDLNIISGSADLDFGLFGSTDAIYYKNRGAYLAQSINTGGAVDEFFTFNVTTADYYGLCLWGNDANTSNYYVTIERAGTWKGITSTDWNNANNWSAETIPDATVDVTIPAGTPYSPVISTGSADCDNLVLDSGATLSIYDMTLVVNGDMNISGEIGMLQDNATMTVMGNVAWNSGSSLNTAVNGSYINVYRDWNFNSGANVNPTQGYIDFRGTTDSWIRCYSDNSSFYRLRNYKSGGASTKVSNLCTEDLVINGLIYTTSTSIFESLSNFDIIMRGNFNYYGTFDFTLLSNTGSVIFDGTSQNINNYSSGSGIFNNVVFSASTSATLVNESITVAGDLTIEQGTFNSANYTVTVGGNWTNSGGTFSPGTSMVIFDSNSDHQDVNETNFYDVQQVNNGYNLRFYGNTTIHNLELNYFSWAYGTINVNGTLNIDNPSSKFTANGASAIATIATLNQGGTVFCNGAATITINDLVESVITGTYYADDIGGVINLSNNGSVVDLAGNLYINGGTMNITGSVSWWPFNNDASVTMTDGVLDVSPCGIYLSGSNTLTETITGGTIRTAGGFTGVRTDFNPTGGTIELYGTVDASLSMGVGSNFYDVQINKAATDKITKKSENEKRRIRNRDGSVIELTRANTVNVTTDLDINGNLQIDNGTFDLNGFNVNVRYILNNYGNLIVDSTLDIGDDCYYYSGSTVDLSGTMQIGTYTGRHGSSLHYTGSTFNQTVGDYYVESIHLYDGSQFNGTGGTTHMYVNGHVLNNNIEIDDPDSYFQYFDVNSGASAALYNCSYDLTTYSTYLHGPLDINSYTMNSTYFDAYDVLTIDSGGTVNVTGNGPYFSSLGSLTMISGSELNSNLHIRFYTGTTENVSGGDIFLAGSFTDANNIFSPTGGSVTFDGSSASSIIGPTAFYDLNIDKTGATVTASSAFSVTNNLDITSGALTLNGYTVDVANDVDVYGTLNMTNAADILNVGDAAYDNLAFRNGSLGNLTAGTVNLASWLWVDVGGLLTATTGNTMNFSGPGMTGIEVDAAGSVFGNINVVSVNPFQLYSVSSQLIEVDGNFDLQAGNAMEFLNNSMIVHGLFTDDPTSIVYVYNGPVDGGNTNLLSANGNRENQNDINITNSPKNSKDSRSRGGYFEIDTDFTLNGLMDVGDGDVLVHGEFELATTGTLTINGGSFISDESTRDRAWRYLRGTFNLSDGLFEITNNSTNFASTATTNISGGTIRTGGAFYGVHTGTFQPTGGIVEIIGGGGDDVVYCSNGNYFYDFVINRDPGIYAALMNETHVQNDLTINSGILSCNFTTDDLYVGGNWTNNVGTGGFLPNISTVIFDGTGDVSITPGETFYDLTLDKVSSADHLDLFGSVTVGNDLTINPGALYSNDNTISVSGNVSVNSGGVLYMETNSILEIGDAKSLNVFSGGTLEVLGVPGNLATITHCSSGNYNFNVYSGATISAEYGLFEYMTDNGVYVWVGGIVDPIHSFNYSTFQNGYVGPGTLLYINNANDLTITGANFPDSSSTYYNVAKTMDQGTITLISAIGDFAGPDYEYDLHDLIHWDGYNPDLDITNVNWTDTNPYVCDMINVEITIYNNGNVSIPGGSGFYVDLYYNLGSPPAPLETGDQSEYITSEIPTGDFIVVDFDVVYDIVESWNSYIQVDTDEEITELNEGNNIWGPNAITWNGLPTIDDLTIQYNVGTNEIELNWTYPITVDQYIIYRSTDPYDFVGADVFTSSTESYSESVTSTKYFYQVTAERTCTASDNSHKEKTGRSRKR